VNYNDINDVDDDRLGLLKIPKVKRPVRVSEDGAVG
jgi:hypothetical protein